jgi:hypothetical protein
MEDAARELGVRTLLLEVVDVNAALSLYQAIGFHQHESTFLSKWIAPETSKPRGQHL